MGRALVVALVMAAVMVAAYAHVTTAAAAEEEAAEVSEDGWAYYDSAEAAAASFLETEAADVEADAAEDEADADAADAETEADTAAEAEADAEAEAEADEEHAVLMELDADTEAALVAEAQAETEAELQAEADADADAEVSTEMLAEAALMRARLTLAVDKAVRVVADADTLAAAETEWNRAKGSRPVSSFAVEQQARVVPLMALQHRGVNYLLAEFASQVVESRATAEAQNALDAETLLLEAAADTEAEAGIAALNADVSAGAFMNAVEVTRMELGLTEEARALYQAMKVELAYRMAAHVVSGWSEDSDFSFPRFRAAHSTAVEARAVEALEALDSVAGVWDTLKSAGSAAYNFGKDMVNDTVDTMKQGYEAVKDLPSSAMDCASGKGCGKLAENGLKIADAATSLPISPTGLLKSVGKTALKKVAKKLIKDKVKDMAKKEMKDVAKKGLKDKLKDKVKQEVKDKVKDELKEKAHDKAQEMADKQKEKDDAKKDEDKKDGDKPEKPEDKDKPDAPEMPEKPDGGDRGGGDRGGDRDGGDRGGGGDRDGGDRGRGDRRRGGDRRGGDRDGGDRGDRDRGGR